MATREDVNVDYTLSPRVVSVESPSEEIIIQDIVDTLRIDEESFHGGLAFKKLVDASGKDDLGGGVQVGITAALQDALVEFEARTTPVFTGDVTTGSSAPVKGIYGFQDASGLFVSSGVKRGALLINFSDQSIADVHEVVSETELRTKVLKNGITNTFQVNDVYHIFNVIQVKVTGGNLVAVDDIGSSFDTPILPSAFTQVILTAASSATLTNTESKEEIATEVWGFPIRSSVPALDSAARSVAEGGFQNGAVWLDGEDGRDTNIGAVSQPVKTFGGALAILREWDLKRIRVVSQVSLLLDVDLLSIEIISDARLGEALLDFNDKAVAAAHFDGLGLTGTVVPAESGAILHYRMNESTGTNVSDASGNSNNGTTVFMDDTNWVAGKINNGLQFDGGNEGVDTAAGIGDFERTDPFTVECWIKTTGTVQTIFDHFANILAGRGWFLRTQTSGRIQFILQHDGTGAADRIQVFNDVGDPSFIPVNDDVYHHVVCTYDGSSMAAGVELWVDAVAQTSNVINDSLTGTTSVPATITRLGLRGFGAAISFAGTMDEAIIYDKKLSSLEIIERYNAGVGTETAGLSEFLFSAANSTMYSPMSGIGGTFLNCGLICNAGETFAIQPNRTAFVNCYAATPDVGVFVAPRFDFTGTDVDVVFRKWSGSMEVLNVDDVDSRIEIESTSGIVTLDASCTAGTIIVRGDCTIVDNTAVGCTVIDETTSSNVWEETATDHTTAGSTGLQMNQIKADTTQIQLDTINIIDLATTLIKYQSNRSVVDQTAKTLTIYDDDGTTPIKVFDLYDFSLVPSVTTIAERVPQ